MNFLIIINPNSGKRKSISVFKKYLKPSLENNLFRYDIKTTTHSGHAKQIIESIDLLKFNAILVLGGDGRYGNREAIDLNLRIHSMAF